MKLTDLETPALILDRPRLMENIRRMRERAVALGVALRPHVKTTKSANIAELATDGKGPITVSTLKEAEYYLTHGFRDMTYAVGITPPKLARVAALQRRGARLSIILDSLAMAHEVVRIGEDLNTRFLVLVEIDCGASRAGLAATDPTVLKIARYLHNDASVELAGVITHAGHSYKAKNIEEIREIAEEERQAVVAAATAIERAGIPCIVRSVGSTPTATYARHLEGVTEIRPGVYMLGDVFQLRLQTCRAEDIALSVLATIISHKPEQNFAIVDAGGLALSMDRSAADRFSSNIGYGLVYDAAGKRLQGGIILSGVHQEHGWLIAQNRRFPYEDFPIGAQVRIFPNHACMTAAAFDRYHVVKGTSDVIDIWGKVTGW